MQVISLPTDYETMSTFSATAGVCEGTGDMTNACRLQIQGKTVVTKLQRKGKKAHIC